MNKEFSHIDPKHSNSDEFLKKLQPDFSKSKEDVWNELEKRMETPLVEMRKPIASHTWFRVAAIIVVILTASFFILRNNTTTVATNNGEHESVELPDGSMVTLNAGSQIVYKKYWWRFNREVEFEGEAFFEVAKGETFTVLSKNGRTEVLGTSFNINARAEEYRVFCYTGKVRVSNLNNSIELMIKPGELAIIDDNIGMVEYIDSEKILAWTQNKFSFISEPLKQVLTELERQYNVKINFKINDISDFVYSGYFDKTSTVDSTLEMICQSFDLTFVKLDNSRYKVLQE